MKFFSVQEGAYLINPAQIASIERKDSRDGFWYTLTMSNGQEFDVDAPEDIDKMQRLIEAI